MTTGRRPIHQTRRPFWLPASTFYFLTVSIAIGVFFLSWAILAEAEEEKPWIPAGLLASIAMTSGVVVREIILRRRRTAVYAAQRRIDSVVLSATIQAKPEPAASKLTIERNELLLHEIRKKSEAAKVLGHLAESHREVFALCAQYIDVATRELPNVGVGSPRLAAITRGRDKVRALHEYHMLRWAELEIGANGSIDEWAGGRKDLVGRARRALSVAETALLHYPNNLVLIESRAAIAAFIDGLKHDNARETGSESIIVGSDPGERE